MLKTALKNRKAQLISKDLLFFHEMQKDMLALFLMFKVFFVFYVERQSSSKMSCTFLNFYGVFKKCNEFYASIHNIVSSLLSMQMCLRWQQPRKSKTYLIYFWYLNPDIFNSSVLEAFKIQKNRSSIFLFNFHYLCYQTTRQKNTVNRVIFKEFKKLA